MRKCITVCVVLILMAGSAARGNGVGPHFVNGIFDASEWTIGSNLAPKVSKVVFSNNGVKGGSSLYAVQGTGSESGLLFLMFDYTRNLNPVTSSSFFDVFFQVPPLNKDFGVHFTQSGFSVFEKPNNTVSLLNPDGSLKFSGSPWTPAPS